MPHLETRTKAAKATKLTVRQVTNWCQSKVKQARVLSKADRESVQAELERTGRSDVSRQFAETLGRLLDHIQLFMKQLKSTQKRGRHGQHALLQSLTLPVGSPVLFAFPVTSNEMFNTPPSFAHVARGNGDRVIPIAPGRDPPSAPSTSLADTTAASYHTPYYHHSSYIMSNSASSTRGIATIIRPRDQE